MADEDKADDTAGPTRVEYHLIKGNHFRVIHVDGAIGGITPRGLCHMAIYNERPAIPKLRIQDILSDTELSDERTAKVLGEPNIGITREVELDMIMDERTVRQLHEWFTRRVGEYDAAREASQGLSKDADDES